MKDEGQDDRFFKAKPKKKAKGPKVYYYELREIGMASKRPREDCANCGFPIAGPEAIYYAGGLIPGPFCRVECAAIYNDLKKGVLKRGLGENGTE